MKAAACRKGDAMFRSIVVPLDGSAFAAEALPYVPLLAAPGAAVTLVRVTEPHRDLLPFGHARHAAESERVRTLMTRDLDQRAEPLRAAGLTVTTDVRIGHAADEILACAREHASDLIAMTTHGHSGVIGLAPGSVTNRVLHGVETAVFTFRPTGRGGDATPVIETIVVPLDGSEFAARAVPVAQGLAGTLGASVAVVQAVQDQYPMMYASDPMMEPTVADMELWEEVSKQAASDADQYVRRVSTQLNEAGITATGTTFDGGAAEVVQEVVSQSAHPLIVMTSHGRTGVTRWFLGSIAERLITTAPCPLIILRIEENDTTAAANAAPPQTAPPS
jgi:nucleotide-binding universal stress UspA family protein